MTDKRRRVVSRTGQVVLVLAVGYVVYGQVSTQLEANQATEQKQEAQQDAKSVADPLDEVCRRYPDIRARLGDLCKTAAEVKGQTAQPVDGRNGRDGRGIEGTAIANGRLVITYTDGVVEDKGPITTEGTPGKDGRSITGTTIQDGALILSYSDGAMETVGEVVGEAGRDGRGIASVSVTADYRLLVAYTDGETADVGPLPAGPPGPAGRGIASVAFDMATCTATITYTDGATEPAPMTGCTADDSGPTTTTSSGDAPLLPLPRG